MKLLASSPQAFWVIETFVVSLALFADKIRCVVHMPLAQPLLQIYYPYLVHSSSMSTLDQKLMYKFPRSIKIPSSNRVTQYNGTLTLTRIASQFHTFADAHII